jgi:hypothetical protein
VSGVLYTGVYLYYYLKDATITYENDKLTIENQGCTGDFNSIIFMFAVNVSFLVLFTKFFLDTYKKPNPKRNVQKDKKAQ